MSRFFLLLLVALCFLALPLWLGCAGDDDDNDDNDDDDNDDQTPDLEEMIYIPAAQFGMGCHDPADIRCDFQYEVVQVDAFYLDVYETTYQQYQACLEAGICSAPGSDARKAAGDPATMPALNVSWDNARAYCEWIGKRLPTSAEWELAARGPDGSHDYAWGDNWEPTWANWCDGAECDGGVDGHAGAAPIDAYPKNVSPYGVRNMTGNMLEWTATPSLDFPGSYEVRGGSYRPANGMGDPDNGLLTWMKHADPPELSPDHLGVRCALSENQANDRN